MKLWRPGGFLESPWPPVYWEAWRTWVLLSVKKRSSNMINEPCRGRWRQCGWIVPHQITRSIPPPPLLQPISVSFNPVKLTVRINCHWSQCQNVWLNLTWASEGPVCKPRLSADRALRNQLGRESSDSIVVDPTGWIIIWEHCWVET